MHPQSGKACHQIFSCCGMVFHQIFCRCGLAWYFTRYFTYATKHGAAFHHPSYFACLISQGAEFHLQLITFCGAVLLAYFILVTHRYLPHDACKRQNIIIISYRFCSPYSFIIWSARLLFGESPMGPITIGPSQNPSIRH